MNPISFKDLYVGNYFRSSYTGALFVKHDEFSAAPVKLNGLRDPYELEYEFDPHTMVQVLSESEWPDCLQAYVEQIRAWDWAKIIEDMLKNAVYDKHDDNDQPRYMKWVGTVQGVMPSGKIYAMWTSNQTAEDVNRDQDFNLALDKVCAEKKVYPDWGESGDLFLCRNGDWEEIATKAGYYVEKDEDANKYYWDGPDYTENSFEWDSEAWKDCCITNKLVENVYP